MPSLLRGKGMEFLDPEYTERDNAQNHRGEDQRQEGRVGPKGSDGTFILAYGLLI